MLKNTQCYVLCLYIQFENNLKNYQMENQKLSVKILCHYLLIILYFSLSLIFILFLLFIMLNAYLYWYFLSNDIVMFFLELIFRTYIFRFLCLASYLKHQKCLWGPDCRITNGQCKRMWCLVFNVPILKK